MSTDSVAYVRLFLVLLSHPHTEHSVWKFRIFLTNLSDIVEKAGSLCNLGVKAKLGSHRSANIGNFPGVLEKVLAVRRTVFHPTYEFDQFYVESVNSEVYTGSLTCLKDFILKLFLDFLHNLLDPCRMYPSVCHELMESESGDLPPYRIEG